MEDGWGDILQKLQRRRGLHEGDAEWDLEAS